MHPFHAPMAQRSEGHFGVNRSLVCVYVCLQSVSACETYIYIYQIFDSRHAEINNEKPVLTYKATSMVSWYTSQYIQNTICMCLNSKLLLDLLPSSSIICSINYPAATIIIIIMIYTFGEEKKTNHFVFISYFLFLVAFRLAH